MKDICTAKRTAKVGAKWKGKVIVITGGSSGLGLGLAAYYVQQGAKLALIARNSDKLVEAQQALIALAPRAEVEYYSVDIGDSSAVKSCIAEVIKQFGQIDMLVNSAGVLVEGYFEKTALEDFERVMNTNFIALVNMCHEVLPHVKQSQGCIVNVSSLAGFIGAFGHTCYAASKFAVIGFSEALRTELQQQGVKVQLVCPPEFDSPMVEGIEEGRTPENKFFVSMPGMLSVDQVVKQTVRGIDKGKFIILIGIASKATVALNRWLPSLVRRIIDSIIKTQYLGPK